MNNRRGPKTKKARARHLKDNTGNYLPLYKSVVVICDSDDELDNFQLVYGNRKERKLMQLKWRRFAQQYAFREVPTNQSLSEDGVFDSWKFIDFKPILDCIDI